MKRRDFIALSASAALLAPAQPFAQQSAKVLRVGFLGPSHGNPHVAAEYRAFEEELGRRGFSKGRHVVVDYGRVDDPRGPSAAAAALMRGRPDVLVALGPEVVLKALVGVDHAVPIVIMAIGYDPVASGYVSSLARPGGNITGLVYREPELAAKQLEFLAEAFPDRRHLAVLWDALSADQFAVAERAAKSRHLAIRSLKLEKPPYDFDAAFRALAEGGAQMVLVLSSPLFIAQRPHIAGIAIQRRLPCMFIFKSYVEVGGLMSYGVDQAAMFRRVAVFVAKILRGARPAELPIEQPTEFELAVNLKTARAIGVRLPRSILLRADEVIE